MLPSVLFLGILLVISRVEQRTFHMKPKIFIGFLFTTVATDTATVFIGRAANANDFFLFIKVRIEPTVDTLFGLR